MGTRGAFGVIIGEKEKIGYNQFDSYPAGKGVENLRWLRSVVEDDRIEQVRELAEKCRLVDDTTPPTEADQQTLTDATDLSVSRGSVDDWYCLTRHTHGSIEAMLDCGYILDSHNFPLDSLFCEWGYIVDFDNEVFEVYEGFQEKPHKDGRFADRAKKPRGWKPRYEGDKFWYPIRLVASYPFAELPSDGELEAVEQERVVA